MDTTHPAPATFTEEAVRDLLIGRWTADEGNLRNTGYRMEVDFGLRFHSGGEWTTIEHEPISEYVEFSASGGTYRNGAEDGFGQNLYLLTNLDPDRLAPGWTNADVRSLRTIWERWHLNGMKAGCAHLEYQYEEPPEAPYRRLKLDGEGTVCEVSGYKMGRAWLVEPLPEHVIVEVRRLLALAKAAQ